MRGPSTSHTPPPWRTEDFLGYQPQEVERRVHRAQTHPGDFAADPFADEVTLSPRESAVLRGCGLALALTGLLALAACAVSR